MLPLLSRNAMSCSPSMSTRTGSPSAAGNSSPSMAGSQYSRNRLPMGVPGPTRVINSFSSWLSMFSFTTPVLDVDGRLVVRLRGLGLGEQLELLHPAVSLLVDLAGVRLEDDPLAWAEGAHVDQRLELVGHLAQVVVGELLVLDVDVALRALQCAEVFLHVRQL